MHVEVSFDLGKNLMCISALNAFSSSFAVAAVRELTLQSGIVLCLIFLK